MGETIDELARHVDLRTRARSWAVDRSGAVRDRMVAVGRAGLSGWRAKVASRVSRPVAERSRLSPEEVEAAIGGAFIVLAFVQLLMLAGKLSRAWREAPVRRA